MPCVAADYQQLKAKSSKSIFVVFSQKNNQSAPKIGSGVAISPNLIATNCHVTDNAKLLMVGANVTSRKAFQAKTRYAATQVYTDKKNDLCILKVSQADFVPVTLRASDTLKIGEDIYAIGAPKGNERFFSVGKIVDFYQKDNTNHIVSDQVINQGSSGGGLFDLNGNLIGITSALTDSNNQRYSLSQNADPLIAYLHNTTNTPELLKQYNKKHTQLYRLGTICYLTLKSQNDFSHQHSLFIWSPTQPDIGFVFPLSENATKSLKKMQSVITTHLQFHRANGLVTLNKNRYPLYGISNINGNFYIAKLPTNSQTLLTQNKTFAVEYNFHDWSYTENKAIFSLAEITTALKDYQKECAN